MKISVQTGDLDFDFGVEEAYRVIREAGFEAVDLNIDHAWSFGKLKAAQEFRDLCIFEKSMPEILEHYKPELDSIRKNGLTITQAHAPFAPYDVGRTDILAYATEIYKKCVVFCGLIGCKNLIIHGISYKQSEPADMHVEDVRELTVNMYRALIPALAETRKGEGVPVTVCLENLFSRYDDLGRGFREGSCADPYEAAGMIDMLNAEAGFEGFGLCLDTGHLNLLRRDFRVYVPILGKRIKATHIHDNFQINDQHLMPYAGNICWEEFLRTMREAGYEGDLSFETFAQYQTKRVPKVLIPDFLRLIAKIGRYFADRIGNG